MAENIQAKKEILLTAYEYVQKLEKGLNTIVELFREAEDGQALNMLTDALEGVQWLLDTFEATLDIQTEIIEVGDIKNILGEMEQALEDIDYIMLSDLIEYEILPIVQKWNPQIEVNIK
jgi:hypothetical protein